MAVEVAERVELPAENMEWPPEDAREEATSTGTASMASLMVNGPFWPWRDGRECPAAERSPLLERRLPRRAAAPAASSGHAVV